jgi:hypothetical protein
VESELSTMHNEEESWGCKIEWEEKSPYTDDMDDIVLPKNSLIVGERKQGIPTPPGNVIGPLQHEEGECSHRQDDKDSTLCFLEEHF